jgi:HK97 family phage prohead protease
MPDTPGVALAATRENGRPPRDDLVRAMRGGVALRAVAKVVDTPVEPSANANGMPTMYGYFTRFNEWTEIDSFWEGAFMERMAPGSFKKTFREQTPKVLFQHGMDYQAGDKPLGAPDVLREEADGPYYEVPLLDAPYVRDITPGLDAGLYGASFRFSVMREEWVDEPGASEHNPKGLPERTIKEVRCQEFGPVTFPAYPGATAGLRSMTDEYVASRMTRHPERFRAILQYLEKRDEAVAELEPEERNEDEEGSPEPDAPPPDDAAAPDTESTPPPIDSSPEDRAETSHPVGQSRDTATRPASLIYGMSRKETTTPWRL